jgi:uncharacterized protein (DUF362 family)
MVDLVPQKPDSTVFTTHFSSWQDTIPVILEAADLCSRLAGAKRVIIKPNLVEPQPPPITTPVELVAVLVDYLGRECPGLDIVIGEGCGSATRNTMEVFKALGYADLAVSGRATLLDLNEAPLVRLENPECLRWPVMHLPGIVFDSFLLSVPVLKAHSLAGVTLTMKNMVGLAPPAHFQGGGYWKKASFHTGIQEAVFDLNRYRAPDFTLLDATVGMQEAHLWGPTCDPPPNRLAAGFDPVAVDAYGCRLLGIDWQHIGHLAMAHNRLGCAEPQTVIEI